MRGIVWGFGGRQIKCFHEIVREKRFQGHVPIEYHDNALIDVHQNLFLLRRERFLVCY